MKMTNTALSATIRQSMPTRPLDGSTHGSVVAGIAIVARPSSRVPHSYFQSGSSGCLRSHSGRRLFTTGIVAKLYDRRRR